MTQENKSYYVLAYYRFCNLSDPQAHIAEHRSLLESLKAKGRIYVSEEGINGQLSLHKEQVNDYLSWLRSIECFHDMPVKIQNWSSHTFEKLKIKYRKQLVALDEKVDLSLAGEHLPPHKWKEMLEKEDDHILIDVRNDYEWEVGHFEGAELPACSTFREFKEYANHLQKRVDPQKTPVMMYCTGGIRCELFSSLLKKQGFENVYQLDGGVINYGKEEGNSHWKGKLFVFDDRMTVPISDESDAPISSCHTCEKECEDYYNCANMDCNNLFLCCSECLEENKGCCQKSCMDAPRVRPLTHQNPHKPFRKRFHYQIEKNRSETA